jgi:mono/diheme cytochrome c family protein
MFLTLGLSLALQAGPLVVEVKGAPVAPQAAADVVAAGKLTFAARCQLCHGADGNADTAIGRAMKPAPRKFSDAAWQRRTTDVAMSKVILEGGAAHKMSPAMPAFKDLPPKDIASLVAFVRTLSPSMATVNIMADDDVSSHSAPIGPDGVARIVVNGKSGPVTIMGVVDDKSLPYCSVDVAEAAGATVQCVKAK